MILDGLRELLLAAGVAAVHVDQAPQGEAGDHVVLIDVEDDRKPCLDGTDDSLVVTEVDLECKAMTRARARALSLAVAAAVEDYVGPLGARRCRAVWLKRETADREGPVGGRERGRCVQILEAQFQHSPA